MGAGAAGANDQPLPVRRRFEVFEMHMVIYALVEESTHYVALATGKVVFDRLVGANLHAGDLVEQLTDAADDLGVTVQVVPAEE